MLTPHVTRRALWAGALLIVGACSKKAEVPPPPAPVPAAPAAFRVTSVDIGKSVMADKMIAVPGTTFAPRDTVFVSVATEGTSTSAALKARFTFENGQLVNESTQTIAPSGPAHTGAHHGHL